MVSLTIPHCGFKTMYMILNRWSALPTFLPTMQHQTDCPPVSARTGSVSDVPAEVRVCILKPPPPPALTVIKSPSVS